MAASRIRADYEQLAYIAQTFSQSAQACQQMLQSLQLAKDALQGGEWIGRGATAFYAEMDVVVLPATRRLINALEKAASVTQQANRIMKQAEEDAAAIFRGNGGNGGSVSQPTVGANTMAGEPSLPQWLLDLLDGVFLGDFSENSSLLKLLAQIAVGFIPGVGQIADVRDIIANIKNVIEGKEMAWVGLALAVLAIIPGLDALKAGKILKPIFKALGDKGSREVLEFLLKNPQEVGRVVKVLGTVVEHPEVVEALAKNPDLALRLIREGSPELVEAFAKYGDEAFLLLKGIPIPRQVFEGFDLRTAQRGLDEVPGSKLTPEVKEFVTPGVHGDFNQYPIGTRGDFDTKLLWTIDEQGAHFVPENRLVWDSSRGKPSHTNISDTAYFGGEAWRTGPNEITINAGSGAFGYNRNYAKELTGEALQAYQTAMQTRFDRAVEYFKQLGFDVKVIPLAER